MNIYLKPLLLAAFLIIIVSVSTLLYLNKNHKEEQVIPERPKNIIINGKTKVKYPNDFTLLLLGDSMTDMLGNSDEIRAYLKKYYPDKSVEVLNYGFGSTNILSVQERLEKETFYLRAFQPILNIDFDVILFESFGNNPLTQFPLEEGLKKQTEALEKAIKTIQESNPRAKIVFVATIAPDKEMYGKGVVDLSTEKRVEWANIRIAYIKNHIDFAKTHNIPLINIYEKSLDENQNGKSEYLSTDDYIHPSPTGVHFISQEIAKFLFEQNILPRE